MMSKAYASMSREELLSLKEELDKEFQGYKEKGLKLDMSRGKPSIAQLNLSMGMMDVFHSESDLKCEDGTDCRNLVYWMVFRKQRDCWPLLLK